MDFAHNKLHGMYRVTLKWRRCFPPYRAVTIECLETLDTLTDHHGFFPTKEKAVEWAIQRVRTFYKQKVRRAYQAKQLRQIERNKRYADMIAYRTKASTGRTAWEFSKELVLPSEKSPSMVPRIQKSERARLVEIYADLLMV